MGRGLKYSVVGPLLILRGLLGLGLGSTVGTARWVGRRCRRSEDSTGDLAVVVQAGSKRRRPLLIAGATVAVLALGGITFSIVRRSMQPEPSALPPSVDVTPAP
ncbi:MAG: cell wall synthesis protein CwsA [Mycobacterium sp.]|nr:cell wall synthesis protein CwsA [Mycobacterium sp.]